MGDTQQEVTALELVHDERFVLFFRKKAEKMTAAIYFVTDLLPEREPMKWALRDRCLALFTNTLSFNSKKGITVLKTDIADILSLLRVARSAHVLSEMNGKMIEDVCNELYSLLEEAEHKTKLTEGLFDVPRPEPRPVTDRKEDTREFYKTPANVYDMSFRNVSSEAAKPKQDTRVQQKSGSTVEKRKGQIVDVVKVKGTATIGDIRRVIDGVSDKTLQRDVTSLVDGGVLIKKGERRWTTYSLV